MEEKQYMEFRLGKLGAFLPLLTLLVTLILGVVLNTGTGGMMASGFIALFIAWLLAKDSKKFQSAVMKGIGAPAFRGVAPILLLSCVLGRILNTAHMGEALLYWYARLGVPVMLLPVACFLLSTILSCASGSSSAASSALMFVLPPLAYQMGFPPGLCAGAVFGGSVVGDYLAPISDNMIVAATIQECSVDRLFRYKLKYTVTAIVISSILYVVFGFIHSPGNEAMNLIADAAYAPNIIFVIVPLITLFIMLKTRKFYNAMFTGIALGLIMMLVMGIVTPTSLLLSDGVIVGGLKSAQDIIIVLLLLFVIVNITEEVGCMEIIKNAVMKWSAGSVKKCEIAAGLLATAASAIMANNAAGITFAGTISGSVMKESRVSRPRIATYIGGLMQCGKHIWPWAAPLSTAGVLIGAGGAPEGFSAMQLIPYDFFCIVFIIMLWLMILTGFGLEYDTDEILAADSVDFEK